MERRDKELNGKVYSILTPPVRQAMPLCTRVAVLLGPMLGSLNTDTKAGGWDKFAAAIQAVDPAKADALMMDALSISKLGCDGQSVCEPINFERHFDQHRSEVYQVMLWCLWECVKDFFPQLGAFTQIAQEAMKAASPFQKAGQ